VIEQASILDFDIETLAAGFSDPNWVPQKITCVSWSWIGEEEVKVEICGQLGFFSPQLRIDMLRPFLEDLQKADIVTGHNLLRFDLPVLNSELLRLGLHGLGSMIVQDTMRIVKTKGLKKGQDNIAGLLKTAERKKSLDWQQWEDAYEEGTWKTVKARCVSDVIMHKQMRQQMIERGWLKKNHIWSP